MIVELIAYTVVTGWGVMREAGWVEHEEDEGIWPDSERDHDYLAEFAGRLCYQSWARPNPATATNEGYLANILSQQHYSVLEHASATFYVAGVSRSLSHELVRHRHLSFSQVSQRYVDETDALMIKPPAFQATRQSRALDQVSSLAKEKYRLLVEDLTINRGLTRKQARQAARAVLPNATETKFVVTGNLRAWRDVIAKRIPPHADAEIQLLAAKILAHLKQIAPNTFQDFAETPAESAKIVDGNLRAMGSADLSVPNYDYETEGLGGT
jgi:thymidylate synthase (FAD)